MLCDDLREGWGGGRKVLEGYTLQIIYATSKERWLCGHRRAKRSYSTFKVRRGGSEEILLVQGKRNPNKMVGVARGIRGQTHKT